MRLVDEKYGTGLFYLRDDAFHALFELTPVHGSGHNRTDIQLQHPFSEEQLRHVSGDDALRQPFHDGCLSDAGLTD